jgi:hypothetical protein
MRMRTVALLLQARSCQLELRQPAIGLGESPRSLGVRTCCERGHPCAVAHSARGR